MFTLDERLKGLPALKEQVVSLHQSLNQPHLAIPGRKAGTSLAFVVGLRGPSGFAVFVYLYLVEGGECAVYVPSSGTVAADRYQAEEGDALAFVESMGFIMDNLNFRARPQDEQDAMIRSLPVFQREPPAPQAVQVGHGHGAAKPATGKSQTVAALGKLFSAFCLALSLSCVHVATDREREQAGIRYELAVQSLVKSPQQAYKEAVAAIELDPNMAEAWHIKAIVLHTAFAKYEEAQAAYLKALELKPAFSEAHTNLGNLYIDLKRYDDAIREYEMSLGDVLYSTPFIAHGNEGWAYFKKGDMKAAVDHLKASLTLNPKYCLGHMQLGQVYEENQRLEDACKHFTRYREACPDQASGYQREGMCQAKQGQKELAMKSFDTCIAKAPDDDQKDACQKMKSQLTP